MNEIVDCSPVLAFTDLTISHGEIPISNPVFSLTSGSTLARIRVITR